MAVSADGITWTAVSSIFEDDYVYSIAWGGGKFVAGGANGRMAYCAK
ncbi:MAG: hypothetical protein LBD08_05180 [Treponema sp.]|jgi:hypothetical protein|nr:hypothetical protein [Treponema sp.]